MVEKLMSNISNRRVSITMTTHNPLMLTQMLKLVDRGIIKASDISIIVFKWDHKRGGTLSKMISIVMKEEIATLSEEIEMLENALKRLLE